MTDKEAMAMALDALEQMKAKANFECWNLDVCDEAIAALKARLAQPEPIQSLQCFHCQVTIETLNDKVMQLMAQRTEPICPDCKAEVLYECVACSSNNYPPPQRTWVDISDEDIEECFTVTPDLYLKRHIAQRISDKLKEKNT